MGICRLGVVVVFMLSGDRVLQGPTNVARLCFQTVANQPSTNMPLPVIDVDGVKPGGATVANAYGYPGRVIVIGSQPLLEAAIGTTGLMRSSKARKQPTVSSLPAQFPKQCNWEMLPQDCLARSWNGMQLISKSLTCPKRIDS